MPLNTQDAALWASRSNVAELFDDQVQQGPARIALQVDGRGWSYGELSDAVGRLVGLLLDAGLQHGDRIAILSENRAEFAMLLLAAARTGAIAACMNWRQATDEIGYCAQLVAPRFAFVSERFAHQAQALAMAERTWLMGAALDAAMREARPRAPAWSAGPEDGLHILYTSGTTGKPKAALISHRALIARGTVSVMDRSFRRGSTFVAWAPMFHMLSTDNVLIGLTQGGKSVIVDGFERTRMCEALETEANLGWFALTPGMIDEMLAEMRQRGTRAMPMDSVGCMADLLPRHQIAEVTRIFNAPFRNTFGSTESGSTPASGGLIPVGIAPASLAKRQSALCRVRLVDEQGADVANGQPGELLLRSPTLFSGYWGMADATAEAFAGGWYHTGDVFRRTADASLEYVDRRKYLIKSGGENIYPAEIEQILMASTRIRDAAVVRRPDAKWGEVPVVFVAAVDVDLTAEDVLALCRGRIANYKLPREVRFIAYDDLPRNITGKIMRHKLEALLEAPAMHAGD